MGISRAPILSILTGLVFAGGATAATTWIEPRQTKFCNDSPVLDLARADLAKGVQEMKRHRYTRASQLFEAHLTKLCNAYDNIHPTILDDSGMYLIVAQDMQRHGKLLQAVKNKRDMLREEISFCEKDKNPHAK